MKKTFLRLKVILASAILLSGCSSPSIKPDGSSTPGNGPGSAGFTGPGGGGAMFNPAVSPHNPDYAFVACDMTGSFVSTDGGRSWRMFSLKAPVRYFVFDPVDSNIVYAKSIALFKSIDRGRSWSLLYPAPADIKGIVAKGDHAEERVVNKDGIEREVQTLAVDPDNSMKLFAAIRTGDKTALYTSDNQGISWNREHDIEGPVRNIFVDPASPKENRRIFLTCDNSVLERKYGTWKLNPGPVGVRHLNEFAGGFDKASGKFIIYAISGKSYFNPEGDASGIYYSEDGGATWQNMQEGILKFRVGNNDLPEWRSVATCISRPGAVYVSYGGLKIAGDTTCLGVAVSKDYGRTWKLAWQDRSSHGTDLYSSNYAKGWIDERFGPGWGENPFNMAVAPGNPDICYTTDFGRTIRTADGGKTWVQLYTNRKQGAGWTSRGLEVTTGYQIIADPFDNSHMFISTTDIGLMESHDGGASWMSATMNNGIPWKWMNSTYWLAFDRDKKGRAWAAMSNVHDLPRPKMWRRRGVGNYEGGIVMTDDGGKSWTPVSADIGEAAVTHILEVPSGTAGSSILYACAFGKGVYKSADGGKTWTRKNNGIEGNEPFAWRITYNENKRELLLIVCRRSDDGSIGNDFDGAVYRSSDGADSWQKISLPGGTNGPMSILTDPDIKDRLLLSAWGRVMPGKYDPDSGGGIFISDDNGKSWKQVMRDDQHIHDLTFDPRNKTYYACGFNSSAYRSDDGGETWNRIKGYNFKWGKRVDPDPADPEKIYIITFGGGVWHGPARGDLNATDDINTPGLLSSSQAVQTSKPVLTSNIKALITRTSNQEYDKINTDWFGTIQAEALLSWSVLGYPEGTRFVEKWLNYHIEHDSKMNDKEYLETYSGNKSRVVRDGVLPFSLYAGTLGVAFPCFVLWQQTKNEDAKNVCLSVADAVLHYSARDRFGYIAHDDYDYYKWCIPDAGYFSVRALADASALVDSQTARVYLKDAVYQARTSVNLFFDPDKKLTRTIYFEQEGPGKTYWCRASGWMMYTLTALLRHLPKDDKDYEYFTETLRQVADGVAARQGDSGGLHVWVDDPGSPEEVTSTAMTAGCMKEAMDMGWLPPDYNDYVNKAWGFISGCVSDDGKVSHAYTGWAIPAEERKLSMDEGYHGYVPGMVLLAAARILK